MPETPRISTVRGQKAWIFGDHAPPRRESRGFDTGYELTEKVQSSVGSLVL
jgi:hypothetical protein